MYSSAPRDVDRPAAGLMVGWASGRKLHAEAVIVLLCVGLGVLIAVSITVSPIVAVLGLTASAAIVLTMAAPLAALALLPITQLGDAYQVDTPLLSLSLRSVVVIALLATQAPQILEALRQRRTVRVVVVIMLLWTAASVVRLEHTESLTVLRSVVTQLSCLGIVLVAVSFGQQRRALYALAAGATAALLILGLVGLLASYGVVPLPQRFEADRLLLGFSSPLIRNYGLNVSYDAIALLVPLCLPALLVFAFRKDQAWRVRLACGVALASLIAVFLLIFQARGMLLQVVLGAGLLTAVSWRRLRLVAVPAAAAVLVYFIPGLVQSDQISSGIRAGTDAAVVSEVSHSSAALLFGTDAQRLFDAGVAQAGYSAALPPGSGAVVHNAFLENVATGGVFQFAFFSLLQGLMLFWAYRLWRSERGSVVGQILLIGTVLVLLELNLEPATQNVLGNWLMLGLVAACSALPRAETNPRLHALAR